MPFRSSPSRTHRIIHNVRGVATRFVAALVLSATPLALDAQGPSQSVASGGSRGARTHDIPVPSAVAAERTTPITIDGKLDEAAWRAATPITEFTQIDPDEGQPASERTEVRFMFDNGALYVGARMYDKAGRAGVRSTLVRRDDNFNSDYF